MKKMIPILLFSVVCCGCGMFGSLAANCDPQAPKHYSTQSPQVAHVGREVRFLFQDKLGLSDYLVIDFGEGPGCLRLLDRDDKGRYQCTYTFSKASSGRELEVYVRAYRTRGGKDWLVTDRVERVKSPYNPGDNLAATASMTLRVYQSKAVFDNLADVSAAPDWSTAKIHFKWSDGTIEEAPVILSNLGRQITITTGTRPGSFKMTYLPSAEEVDPWNDTPAELRFEDKTGKKHRADTVVILPDK